MSKILNGTLPNVQKLDGHYPPRCTACQICGSAGRAGALYQEARQSYPLASFRLPMAARTAAGQEIRERLRVHNRVHAKRGMCYFGGSCDMGNQ